MTAGSFPDANPPWKLSRRFRRALGASAVTLGLVFAGNAPAWAEPTVATSALVCATTPAVAPGVVATTGSLSGLYAGVLLTGSQVDAAATIVNVGLDLGISRRGIATAIETAMAFSRLDPGARYNGQVGLFQQQSDRSTGLYTGSDRLDPVGASRMFYEQVTTRVPGYDADPRTNAELADAVQESGDVSLIAQWNDLAEALTAQFIPVVEPVVVEPAPTVVPAVATLRFVVGGAPSTPVGLRAGGVAFRSASTVATTDATGSGVPVDPAPATDADTATSTSPSDTTTADTTTAGTTGPGTTTADTTGPDTTALSTTADSTTDISVESASATDPSIQSSTSSDATGTDQTTGTETSASDTGTTGTGTTGTGTTDTGTTPSTTTATATPTSDPTQPTTSAEPTATSTETPTTEPAPTATPEPTGTTTAPAEPPAVVDPPVVDEPAPAPDTASDPGRSADTVTTPNRGAVLDCAPNPNGGSTTFDPGFIVSDEVFYNTAAMSADQIQAFLDRLGDDCTGAACVKSLRVTTRDVPADQYCAAYTGGTDELASAVIAKVSVACGINPQVMLVTLQKEAALLTKTQVSLSSYNAAWGWHCPDSGPGGTANCDPKYAGFFNQAFGMAKQWSRYKVDPGKYHYQAGETANVLWNVAESGCGGTDVTIKNTATASLYNYTPYQPNAAAIAAYPGVGDGCSAYGNRNFFYLFQKYFGVTGGGVRAAIAVNGVNVTIPDSPYVAPAARGKTIVAPNEAVAAGLAAGLGSIGLPYVWGGGTNGGPADQGCSRGGTAKNSCTGTVGFDCSGLTAYVLTQAGFAIGTNSGSQRAGGDSVAWNQAVAGDIIGYSGHVAVYLGTVDGVDYLLEAPDVGKFVQVRAVYLRNNGSSVDPMMHRYWM